MNKQEYLNQIEEMLQDCDREFVTEIIGDFNEHFQQGQKEGKSEEEIAQSLGDISEWVEELKQSYARKQLPELISTPNEIKKILVKTSSVDVKVDSDCDQVSWELVDTISKMNVHNYDVKETLRNGRLTFEVTQKEKNHFWFQISNLHFAVKVPQGMDEIRIETHSGDIDVVECDALDIKLASKSGDVAVEDTRGNLWIKTLSGDIEVESCESEKMVLQSTSGDIEVKAEETETLSAKSTSGEIEIEAEECEEVILESTSGDVEFEGEVSSIKVNTMSGDVDIICEKPEIIWVETASGDVHVEVNECDGMNVLTQTGSGDVNVDFENVSYRDNGSFSWGDESARVVIKTSSGDISLEG